MTRRLPIGAECIGEVVHLRVWAPASRTASVVRADRDVDARAVPLQSEAGGYFSGAVPGLRAGARYWIQLDDGRCYPDPASRFQPEGPHGPSAVVDASTFAWTDETWRGVPSNPVVYELHVGTFTPEGTWRAAARELAALAELGVSLIELMPLSDFPGRFGWGYDGVCHFAPTRLYGTPDDFRSFVDAAHRLGIGVILDVVYNHFGPDGCHLARFSKTYFAERPTEWGQAINFDGEGSAPVREFMIANARYWTDEFHLDGLRLDATQSIVDRSRPHVIAEIVDAVRATAGRRRTWIVAENEAQRMTWLQPAADGGLGIDAAWNDDFHHTAMVALTGHREAYYTDYGGTPQEFISAARHGFLYQGQWYSWQAQPRGERAPKVAPSAFVSFLQNHDQVANSLAGARMHTLASGGKHRALTALLLLGPWVPLVFQGQEFESSAPFLYFADHQGELARAVTEGRREFLKQFPSLAGPEIAARLPDPAALETFTRCKLDHVERTSHRDAFERHRSLLALRRTDPAFTDREGFSVDGAVLGADVFVLRYSARGAQGVDGDRLIVVNLGRECTWPVVPEPLLSAFPRAEWTTIWSSEDPAYGGPGIGGRTFGRTWRLPAESALVLRPDPAT